MDTVLLMICILTTTGQNVLKKQYSGKFQQGVFSFNAISVFFTLLFFLVLMLINGFEFHKELIWYSVAYAVAYIAALAGIYMSIAWGGFGNTSLIVSYSTIIPTVYGIFFLDEKVDLFLGIGFVALVISLYFINTDRTVSDKITVRWIVSVVVAFFGNGLCAVIQNKQQVSFRGAYKYEFMVLALIIVEVVFGYFAFWKEKKFLKNVHGRILPAAACGLCNGTTNLLTMILMGIMASSILFPVISAGGIIISFACSLVLYKERFEPRQKVGIIFGIVAVVLLNL